MIGYDAKLSWTQEAALQGTQRNGSSRTSACFVTLDNFAQLEERIARLETAQERGAAFEVFAEAYISTQNIVQADEVWPEGVIPQTILSKFRLPLRDLGVDGVFRTLSGLHNGYQVKFRSGRPSLT